MKGIRRKEELFSGGQKLLGRGVSRAEDQLAFVNQTVFLSGYSTVSFDNADLRRTAIILVILGLCFDNYR